MQRCSMSLAIRKMQIKITRYYSTLTRTAKVKNNDNIKFMLLSRFSRVQLCATPQTAATRLPRPWGSPGKNTGVGCNFLLQSRRKVKVKSLSHVRLLATTWTAAYQAPPSMGFSRQEYWSGVPLGEINSKETI